MLLSVTYWLLSSDEQLVRVVALRVDEAEEKISLPQHPGQEFMVNMAEPITDGMSDALGLRMLGFKLVRLKNASNDHPSRQSMMIAAGRA